MATAGPSQPSIQEASESFPRVCDDCFVCYGDFCALYTGKLDKLIAFAQKHSLILSEKHCPTCHELCIVTRRPVFTGLWSQRPSCTLHLNKITVKMNGLSTEEDSNSQHDQVCCLVDAGERCTQLAGNAAYNKRIQKTVAQRKLRLHMDSASSHNYICEYHKGVIQSVRVKRKRRDSEEDSGEFDGDHPEVELYNLQVNTLRRYKRHYKIPTRPGLNKAQLVDILMKHFRTVPVAEKECLTYFIYMIKANRSKFDQRNGSNIDM